MNLPAAVVLAATLALIAATAILTYEVLSAAFDQHPEPARFIMPALVIIT